MFSLKSYFVFLGRNKAYAAINLVGFSVALMFVVLLGLYVAGESRADNFHEKGERIYRMLNDEARASQWPVPVGDDVAGRYPEVESYVRAWWGNMVVSVGSGGGEKFRVGALYVDPTFFSVFSFPLEEGERERQLRAATDVTVSREFADKLFGPGEEAVGKAVTIDDEQHIVTGVVGDFGKSHLKTPDIIVSFRDHIDPWYFEHGYDAANFQLYLLVREGADLHPKLGEMADWFRTFFWTYMNGMSKEVILEPITESYFNGRPNYGHSGDRQLIWLMGVATLAILLFALINYVNLSVALSGFRAREAATRRLLGGTKVQLVGSYVAESVVFCLMAFVVGLGLAGAFQGVFNGVMEADVSVMEVVRTPIYILMVMGLVVVLGAVSGLFPAMVVSRYKPIEVVRGELTRKTKMTYSRLFIGLQFLLTIVLIGCAMTIRKQTEYMMTKDLGFDGRQLIHLENTVYAENIPGLRDRLMQVAGVEKVAFSIGSPVTSGDNITATNDGEKPLTFRMFWGDEEFMELFGIEVVSRTGNAADSAAWINQAAMKMLEFTPETDRLPFTINGIKAIEGTVRDFHVDDLTEEVRPVIIGVMEDSEGNYVDHPWDIVVRIDTPDPAGTFEEVKKAYLEYNGGEPFEASFVDEIVEEWYEGQRKASVMVGWFSLLAVVLSAMGLVAMATYFMRQRAREIAVRKVFGATSGQVLERLVAGFLRIVLVAYVLAVPVIWWLMSRWLTTFAYRIPLEWTIFAAAGVIAGAIAVGAVMWQSLKAARTNPVETLHKG